MMRRKNRIIRHNAALISVLCLIFTAGILTAATLALSQKGTFSVYAHVELQRSMLVAEGVANRIQFLLAADRNLNPEDKPGEVDYTAYEYDRFLADGVKHTLDYYGESVDFTVLDAVNGWDMSSSSYQSTIKKIYLDEDAGEDILDLADRVLHRMDDYIDSDEDIMEYGEEAADYESKGSKPLPRNGDMQYREELLYIEGFTGLYPLDKDGRLSNIRLMVPSGSSSLSGTPSLFSADRKMLELMCDLSEDELDTVMDALKQWKEEKILLSDTLDEEVLAKLKSEFSTTESGAYTVMIMPPSDRPRPFRKLVFTYDGFEVSGPENQILRYMEWNFL
ncbi:MAG: general secretion pathway protein GspK [Lentisphaeria bacterium]|nr:general secretion pathway protein GspK [Lentisphaeria bacterium]